MNNTLLKFVAATSLLTTGFFAVNKPAEAATIGAGQLQLNGSAIFFDANPNANIVQPFFLFEKASSDGTGPNADFATNGQLGNFSLVNSGTTGFFAPYRSAPSGVSPLDSGLQIRSIGLPAATPTVTNIGGTPFFQFPSVSGSAITPPTNFPGGTPFLVLDPAAPGSYLNALSTPGKVDFFLDQISTFTQIGPTASNPTASFQITALGTWKSGNTVAGSATVNGTFSIDPVLGQVFVNPATGELCTALGNGCISATKASFGGTLISEAAVTPVPEPTSAIGSVIALGLGTLTLRRNRKQGKDVVNG
jgi:hypothetical protein